LIGGQDQAGPHKIAHLNFFLKRWPDAAIKFVAAQCLPARIH
jgi:hypothetical protein